MRVRVKIEFTGRDAARYAYITDEHAMSSRGIPVIEMGGEAYNHAGMAAMDGTVVTADRELAAQLEHIGYTVRVSNPQARWEANNRGTISTRVSKARYETIAARAEALGLAMSGYIQQLIQADLDGRVGWPDE